MESGRRAGRVKDRAGGARGQEREGDADFLLRSQTVVSLARGAA